MNRVIIDLDRPERIERTRRVAEVLRMTDAEIMRIEPPVDRPKRIQWVAPIGWLRGKKT